MRTRQLVAISPETTWTGLTDVEYTGKKVQVLSKHCLLPMCSAINLVFGKGYQMCSSCGVVVAGLQHENDWLQVGEYSLSMT